ncbi:hypothetical protein [Burkholderia contaminans]|uniref:hypothetical protein n=1 Tax=Burkholderia contaminans TaxID=488447 RepID=UPI000F595F85|nr:hypothetical protein [Burkholderia contaminans]
MIDWWCRAVVVMSGTGGKSVARGEFVTLGPSTLDASRSVQPPARVCEGRVRSAQCRSLQRATPPIRTTRHPTRGLPLGRTSRARNGVPYLYAAAYIAVMNLTHGM